MPTGAVGSKRDIIVRYLKRRGGAIRSETGIGVTAKLAEVAGYKDAMTVNGLLVRMEADGIIRREVRGKRTYAVELVGPGGSAPRRQTSVAAGGPVAVPALESLLGELRTTQLEILRQLEELTRMMRRIRRRGGGEPAASE